MFLIHVYIEWQQRKERKIEISLCKMVLIRLSGHWFVSSTRKRLRGEERRKQRLDKKMRDGGRFFFSFLSVLGTLRTFRFPPPPVHFFCLFLPASMTVICMRNPRVIKTPLSRFLTHACHAMYLQIFCLLRRIFSILRANTLVSLSPRGP